ncbi:MULTISPECIES: tRNA pseudouridine(38-40) synthase TruA [unclassified Neochlamydia]|uniref:tRNA pseudouridine(38-40) synthase TruA n=1 Tax=unclassified Neochlamydia TaxID=2643326 RepID=UPI001BC969ED|nr:MULTISPECIES: tRNA pseudouridine(38-40) synthase TruA [unclassified Neochlamydia]MBS4165817.1 tRNA pseudouridine synthase A 2 [Neochlamydia sp. AcF65]MBS4171569.1 tRNA pseudouridine synthase A 2 [Neochlamydia sp. AcF95]
MKNIKLQIAYDGTSYLGWQKTSLGPTIEASLEKVLERILQHPVTLQAASRTDAGVHAHGQVINFFTTRELLNYESFKISLNQLLPPSIAVLEAQEASQNFHPTLDCIQKEYHYFICKGAVQMPHNRLYSWHCPRLSKLAEMKAAAKLLVGKKDFSAFCNFKKHVHYASFVRQVDGIEIQEVFPDRLLFKVVGQSFLYKMVRNIVGTLAYIGMGKMLGSQIPAILANHDRRLAGITAPAHGLCLYQLKYLPA